MKFSNNTFFFVLDVGNSDIVISLIKNFKIYKIKRLKTKNFRNNNKVLFKGFNEIWCRSRFEYPYEQKNII